MREVADADRIRRFMRAFGRAARSSARVYLTGGATAVLLEWRPATIHVDLKIVPDADDLLRAIPDLKETLQINVELASPADFIPVREGCDARSPFITREGLLSFHHFDLTAQALAKIERGHAQDRQDVRDMLTRWLVQPDDIRATFERIAPNLHRYPAVDPSAFRRAVEKALEPRQT
jgi:hypothetical protein